MDGFAECECVCARCLTAVRWQSPDSEQPCRRKQQRRCRTADTAAPHPPAPHCSATKAPHIGPSAQAQRKEGGMYCTAARATTSRQSPPPDKTAVKRARTAGGGSSAGKASCVVKDKRDGHARHGWLTEKRRTDAKAAESRRRRHQTHMTNTHASGARSHEHVEGAAAEHGGGQMWVDAGQGAAVVHCSDLQTSPLASHRPPCSPRAAPSHVEAWKPHTHHTHPTRGTAGKDKKRAERRSRHATKRAAQKEATVLPLRISGPSSRRSALSAGEARPQG